MAVFHSREEAKRCIETMPKQCFTDGLLLDVPKRRRREEAQGKREFRPRLAKDQQRRLVIQFERYISELTKDMGVELMLKLLERPATEDLKPLLAELTGAH
jgi:hypothetical protein